MYQAVHTGRRQAYLAEWIQGAICILIASVLTGISYVLWAEDAMDAPNLLLLLFAACFLTLAYAGIYLAVIKRWRGNRVGWWLLARIISLGIIVYGAAHYGGYLANRILAPFM